MVGLSGVLDVLLRLLLGYEIRYLVVHVDGRDLGLSVLLIGKFGLDFELDFGAAWKWLPRSS